MRTCLGVEAQQVSGATAGFIQQWELGARFALLDKPDNGTRIHALLGKRDSGTRL